MTEEESKNLRKGDVYQVDYDGNIALHKFIEHWENDIGKIYGECIESNVHWLSVGNCGWDQSNKCTLLPLYSSPLYLAMNEKE